MKSKHLLCLLMALLFCYAQAGINSGYYGAPEFSLTNDNLMNIIEMQHSLSFSSGFSSNGEGYYSNIYTNHLLFDLHPDLKLKLNLNFANNGSLNFSNAHDFSFNNDNQSQVYPEFQLEWKPGKNTTLRIAFQRQPIYGRWETDFIEEDAFGDMD